MVAKSQTHVSSTSAQLRAARIAALNDSFRQTCVGGTITVTSGIVGLGRAALADILAMVRAFDRFTDGNDPYAEHDFGSVRWGSCQIFWKIDYYDPDLRCGSADPADPSVTARVLTIMLAEEY